MYGQNQMNGLGSYLGELRQAPNGQIYQLGEVVDERGNVGLGWQPYDQPQLGEVRRGTDGQLYQYGVDGFGNVGFAPLVALASKALPAIANAIPGVSNLVRGLIPGGLPGLPSPVPPVSATVSVPAPMPGMYPRPGLRAYLNNLVPRIAEFFIEHAHRLAGKSLVLRQIKITARGDALEFLALQLAALILLAERELE